MKKIITFISFIMVFGNVFSQDSSSTSAFKISGSADVYYKYNFNNPKDPPYNNLTSFTNSQNSFELGMASIQAAHSFNDTLPVPMPMPPSAMAGHPGCT